MIALRHLPTLLNVDVRRNDDALAQNKLDSDSAVEAEAQCSIK